MPERPPQKKKSAALEHYRTKRNFRNTPEPRAGKKKHHGRIYVVQEHHARSHHFDFRLEIDGVLASWAVPKGIPEDPAAKRLAVHVEDHPLDYAAFEGEIPEGNYGAGTVAIWDSGEWEPLEKDWKKQLERHGKLKFTVKGGRLNGAYVLARMGKEPNWLMRQIDTPPPAEDELEKEKPGFVRPQLAKVVPSVPAGKEWIHELKLDGYRLIAVRRSGKVTLFTRNGLDWTEKFTDLAAHIAALPGKDFILDGEAVVYDKKGHTKFGLLQDALKTDGGGKRIVYIAFDILHHDGRNLRPLPLLERLKALDRIVTADGGPVRRSKVWPPGEGAELFKQSCRLGLEGIISKKSSGAYHEGARRDWMKSKCRPRQEFVICGFTPPKNSCPAFGALVLGSFEGGKLIPRGKVGTGFSDGKRRTLLAVMKKLGVDDAPFESGEKHVTWIRPELVAEIGFTELTGEGSIRQGSFIALREDKKAKEVHLDAIGESAAAEKDVKVMGIAISHPGRIVYPRDAITKVEVARYYERVADLILPHVKNRPLAILRAPDGISGQTFFQKSFKTHVPEHVHTKTLEDGTEIFHVTSAKGLVSLAQFGAIEIHPWGSTLTDLEKPDRIIWDLDPHEDVPWTEVLGAAYLLRDHLAEMGLETVVKTSGGKGLHVVLPLRRNHRWEVMKAFAKSVATAVAEFNPKRFLVKSSLKARTGKIYIDWLRNGRGATCIAPWGLRARNGAAVSAPIDWDDLHSLARSGFTINEPFSMPGDWKNIKPQSVTEKHL